MLRTAKWLCGHETGRRVSRRSGFQARTVRKLLLFSTLLFPFIASAQTGSCTTATCKANGTSQADFLAALPAPTNTNSTVVVNVPLGSSSWTSGINYTVPAAVTNLTIQGQTTVNCTGTAGTSSYTCTATDNTVLIDSVVGTVMLRFNLGGSSTFFRVTGITFQGGSVGSSSGKANGFVTFSGSSLNLRGDHNHFNESTYGINAGAGLTVFGTQNGVFDHNLFTMINQSNGVRYYPEAYGFTAWSQPTGWGTSNFIFIENNVFTGGFANDCDFGGREVIRYNTITADRNDASADSGAIQTHQIGQGLANPKLGCRTTERYHNYLVNPTPSSPEYTAGDLSSGTNIAWGNTIAAGYNNGWAIYMTGRLVAGNNCGGGANNAGACPAPQNGYGYCGNASSGVLSVWDGNMNSSGYPCLSQSGRGQGDPLSGNFPNLVDSITGTATWPHQFREPIYVWNETLASGNLIAIQNISGYVSTANRDYYSQVSASPNTSPTSPFNGTTGTGFGPSANRPTTCTAGPGGTFDTSPTGSYGVAYFATDANSGNGELYVCTSTNTWTPIYQPYTYPHPLTAGGTVGGNSPLAPTNLVATVQ